MSFYPVAGNLRTVAVALSTTSPTTILPAGQIKPMIQGISVANASAGAVTVLVELVRGGLAFALIPGESVAAKGRVAFKDMQLALLPSDEIRATAGTAGALAVVMTVVERSGAIQ